MKKTISEWSEIFEIQVLDPDGFDRTDKTLMCRRFTKEQFEEGLMMSTVMINHKHFNGQNPMIMIYKVTTEACGSYIDSSLEGAMEMFKIEIQEGNYEVRLEATFMRKETYENLPEFEG